MLSPESASPPIPALLIPKIGQDNRKDPILLRAFISLQAKP
jgi:hypothetical protein